MKRWMVWGGVLLLISLLFGCSGKKRAEETLPAMPQEALARQMLEKKYGEPFSVDSVEKTPANRAFGPAVYTAAAHSEALAGTFTARWEEGSSAVADDYARLFWENSIQDRVRSALRPYAETAQWTVVYELSRQTWRSTDELDRYLKESETYVDLELTVSGDAAQAAGTVNAVRHALLEAQLQYAMSCSWNGASVVLSEKNGLAPLTDEDVRQKLERSAG